MALVGAINILLGLEHSKFTTGTQKAAGSLRKFKAEADTLHSSMGKLNGVLGGFGLSLGIAQTVSFLHDSVAAFEETHKASLKLNAVLEATGGVAGRSFEQLETMVDELERLTAVDDAVIKGGAAVLATFKSLSGDGFDRALKGAVDLAAVMETDVKSAALQLGKALSDPANGLAALGRAGVKFTEEEKKMIAELVEANRTLEAQDMILDKLEGKVGGVAGKMATDIDKLGVAWGNLKESIGEAGTMGPGGVLVGWMTTYIESLDTLFFKTNEFALGLGKLKLRIFEGRDIDAESRRFKEIENTPGPQEPKPGLMNTFDFLDSNNPREALFKREFLNDLFLGLVEGQVSNPGASGPRGRFTGVDENFLTTMSGPALPKSGFFGRSSADEFEASLIAGMDKRLAERQQANLDAADIQPRAFAGFATGAERGSADAFQQIAAFKFGNVGQEQKDRERAIKEAEKQNVKLEQIHMGLKQFIDKAEFQELKIDE